MRSLALVLCVALCPLGTSHARAQEAPEAAVALDAPREERFDLEWVGWPLAAAGAIFLAGFAGTYARIDAMNQDPDFYSYRLAAGSMPGVTNACDAASSDPSALAAHARSLCSEASILEPLQYVLLVAGAASVVAGLSLVIVDANASEAPVTVAVGPGGVSLHGSF